jgi:hypothetical protein
MQGSIGEHGSIFKYLLNKGYIPQLKAILKITRY